MSIRILLVDDHEILREGLRAILRDQKDIEVVGEAQDGKHALELADKLCPDVVVMDINMPDLNGVEATRRLTHSDSKIKVIALSTFTDKQFVLEMLEAGAVGFVVKDAASSELIEAIRAAMRNRKYLSPSVAGSVVDSYVGRTFPSGPNAFSLLGPKEREVLQLIAEGKTSRQIGARLNISDKTVEVHRRNIMLKLDLHSVAELTKYAVREGLTSP